MAFRIPQGFIFTLLIPIHLPLEPRLNPVLIERAY